MERDTGIEPVSSAWKAEVITTIRIPQINQIGCLTNGPESRIRTSVGTNPADLQSAAIDHSANSGNATVVIQLFKNLSTWINVKLVCVSFK
jgi:hypothetical protein